MDKYRKIKCVEGLIKSLDEQLARYDQIKGQMSIQEENSIVNQYYDAILEQLDQPKDENNRKFILTLKKRGIISEEQKMELLYPKHENVGDETPEHVFHIIINGKRHIIHTPEENQTIDWEKIVLLSGLTKTGNEILTITFTYNEKDVGESEGLLEVNESIKVTEGMIFSVCNTSKGEK